MSVTTIGKWCQGNEEGRVHEGLNISLPVPDQDIFLLHLA